MSGYLPRHTPGDAITRITSDAVIGGRLVDATAAHADAGSTTIIGVAAKDTASGQPVTVYSGGVQHITAAGPIAIGDHVVAAADGKITAAAADADPLTIVGIALAAGAADADIDIKFLR